MRLNPASIVVLASVAACGAADMPGGSFTGLPAVSSNSVSAAVTGRHWTTTHARVVYMPDAKLFALTVFDSVVRPGAAFSVSVPTVTATGTYTEREVSGWSGTLVSGDSLWSSGEVPLDGTVTFTLVSPTRVAGSFWFRALLEGSQGQCCYSAATVYRPEISGTFDLVVKLQ